MGQLHGGQASCSNQTWDEYGRFDLSWNGGSTPSSRLSDWLDPLGSDPMTLGGLDHNVCLNPGPKLAVKQYFTDDYRGNADDYPDLKIRRPDDRQQMRKSRNWNKGFTSPRRYIAAEPQ